MAKKANGKERIKFKKGHQKSFIDECRKELHLPNSSIAKLLNVSVRTLTDWKREKFLIPKKAAEILSKRSKIALQDNFEIRKQFWYVSKGAKIGGLTVYKKYGRIGGDPKYRLKKWQAWWKKEGRFKPHPIINATLPITIPKKSDKLAEFVGIVLGDGGMTKNQLRITLNFKDDTKYILYVKNLIQDLFGVKASIYRDQKDSVDDIAVSRVELIRFCNKKLGLKTGNKIKQQVDIPRWILNNRRFRLACVRGLMDTDGSVFTHSYKVNGTLYNYKKMAFTSRSKPLISSVFKILKDAGLRIRIAQKGRDVRIDSIKDVKKYFSVIGTNNPKHLQRYLG